MSEKRNPDSYADMLAEVQAFHTKHDFKGTGGQLNISIRTMIHRNITKM